MQWNVKYQNKSQCKIGDTRETTHLGRNGLSVITPCRGFHSADYPLYRAPPPLQTPIRLEKIRRRYRGIYTPFGINLIYSYQVAITTLASVGEIGVLSKADILTINCIDT